MRKLLTIVGFLSLIQISYSQINSLYGLFLDNDNLKFVKVDRTIGEMSEICNIPGNPGINTGSSTCFLDSGQYFFVGWIGNPPTYYLFTIEIEDGSVKSIPINACGSYELEFDPITKKLFGLWSANDTQKFVMVDRTTGEMSEICNIPGNPGINVGSSTFSSDSGLYFFVGWIGNPPLYYLYTINIKDGSVKSIPIKACGSYELEFDPITQKLFGLWLDSDTQKFVTVDRTSGELSEISNITGNPGLMVGSSTFFADSGQYFFEGFIGNPPTYYLYAIDIKDGSAKYTTIDACASCEFEIIKSSKNLSNTESISLENDVKVYPNPLIKNHTLNISGKIKHIEIIDVNGYVLRSYRIKYNNSIITSINLSGISNGIYFLKLTSNTNKIYFTKLLVKI